MIPTPLLVTQSDRRLLKLAAGGSERGTRMRWGRGSRRAPTTIVWRPVATGATSGG